MTTRSLTNTGACVATLENGKIVFVDGALPGEEVEIQITHNLSKRANAIVVRVIKASPQRVGGVEDYSAEAPWKIMRIDYENRQKGELIKDAYRLSGIDFEANGINEIKMNFEEPEYNYRSKYEYFFEQDGYNLASVKRLSNDLEANVDFSLPKHVANQRAMEISQALENGNFDPKMLHSLLIRASESGDTFCRLFVRCDSVDVEKCDKMFANVDNIELCQVGERGKISKHNTIYRKGKTVIYDYLKVNDSKDVKGNLFQYKIGSFFQINKPIYERALQKIWQFAKGDITDFYSGVGTIGISCINSQTTSLTLVDSDRQNYKSALQNVNTNAKRYLKADKIKVLCVPANEAITEIKQKGTLIVNPTRNGLSKKVVERVLEVKPERVIYLSCNPSTQARDLKHLLEVYKITHLEGYNFFPKTPHIECLVVLDVI